MGRGEAGEGGGMIVKCGTLVSYMVSSSFACRMRFSRNGGHDDNGWLLAALAAFAINASLPLLAISI